ncbi:MAG: hypothetical protein AB4368_26580 [Xenococcaceae cyanobacterium]
MAKSNFKKWQSQTLNYKTQAELTQYKCLINLDSGDRPLWSMAIAQVGQNL